MKPVLFSLFAFFTFFVAGAQSMLERYQKAEQFLPKNTSKLTQNVSLRFHAVDGTNDFWFRLETADGEKYYYFEGDEKKTKPAFDHQKLADAIFKTTDKKFHPDSLDLEQLSFQSDSNKITFRID